MSSHTNSSFLNSCVKVPIDPCNRCPAPTFGRPLIYYGKDKECSKRKKKYRKKMLSGCESGRKTKEALQNLTSFYHSIPDYAEINHLPKDEFYNTLERLKTACVNLVTENAEIESSIASIDSFKQKKRTSKKNKRQKSKTPPTCLRPDVKGFGITEDKPFRFDTYKAFRDHITRKELQKLDLNAQSKREGIKFESYKSFREHIDHKIKFNDDFEDAASDNQDTTICGEDCKFNKKQPNIDCINSSFIRDQNYSDSKVKDATRTNNYLEPKPKHTVGVHNYLDPHPKDYNNYKSFREDLQKMFESELETNFLEYKHEDVNVNLPVEPHSAFHIEQSDELLSVFQENVPDEPINIIDEAEIIRKYNKYFENIPSSPKVEKKKSLSVNDLREDVENKLTLREEPKEKKAAENLKRSFTSCHLEKNKPKVTVEVLPPTPIKVKQSAFVSPFSLLLPKKQKRRPISASPVYPVARPNLAATLRKEISKKKLQDLDNHCTFRDTNTPQVDWEVRKTPAWKTLNLSESHKNVLSIRLATRKAEQKRQESEYELQMLMMKQRVKSAPLLLEGPTHWGPHVGKLTHSCHKDNSIHQCSKTRVKNKRTGSGCSKQRAMMPLPPPTRKTISRCSINSTNLNDSDDLCSLDRAYL